MKKLVFISLLCLSAFLTKAQTLRINKYLVDSMISAGVQVLYYDTTHTGQWKNISQQAGGGGSGSGTVNSGTQYRIAYYAATGTAVSAASAITGSRALVSDANGVPTHSTVTTTELGYVSGVTSAIQTQLNAKQSSSLTDGYIFVGNGSNIATGVALSGDATIINTGAITISNLAVTNAKIANATIDPTTKLSATGTPSSTTVLAGDNTWKAAVQFNLTGIRDNDIFLYDSTNSEVDNYRLSRRDSSADKPVFVDTATRRFYFRDMPPTDSIEVVDSLGGMGGNIAMYDGRAWIKVDAVTYKRLATDSTVVVGGGGSYTRAFSIRKVVAGYAGSAIRLRRSSDNAEVDVSFDGSDEISGSSLVTGGSTLTTWKGADNLFVVTWYDQSGNGSNATQATAANQPSFELVGINSKPSVSFDASNDYLSYTAAFSGAGARSLMVVYKLTSTTGEFNVVGQSVGTTSLTWFSIQSRSSGTGATGHPYLAVYAGDLTDGTAPNTTSILATALYTGTVSYLRRNGTQIDTETQTLNTTSSNPYIGRNVDGGYFAGFISEILMTDSGSAPTADETSAISFYAL